MIAQALLEDARSQSNERKNAAVRGRLLVFRFPELKRFEPWQRNLITRRCSGLVMREPITIFLFILWLLFACAVWFMPPPRLLGVVSLGQLSVLVGLLLLLFHRIRVRQYVRAFLKFVEARQENDENSG